MGALRDYSAGEMRAILDKLYRQYCYYEDREDTVKGIGAAINSRDYFNRRMGFNKAVEIIYGPDWMKYLMEK